MNHSYFASLLENYRRRMEMDASVLSVRKALHQSYQNESFKLKERQRQAMAKQRRDDLENERKFRNRVREIAAKEREISKRYEHLRKPDVRGKSRTLLFPGSNAVLGWSNEQASNPLYQTDYSVYVPRAEKNSVKSCFHTSETKSRLFSKGTAKLKASTEDKKEKTLTLPAVNAPRWITEHATELYQTEPPRAQRESTLSKSCGIETGNRVPRRKHNLTEMIFSTPSPRHSPVTSNFTSNLINYYKNGKGLTSSERNSREFGKKTSMSSCTLKFGEQPKHTGRRGPFNMSSQADYDILVLDHGEDDSVSQLSN